MLRTEYDWSRNLTNINADAELGGSPPQNPWNLRAEYSNEQFQYRHKFLVYYVYELPVGRGRKWLGELEQVRGWRAGRLASVRYHDLSQWRCADAHL